MSYVLWLSGYRRCKQINTRVGCRYSHLDPHIQRTQRYCNCKCVIFSCCRLCKHKIKRPVNNTVLKFLEFDFCRFCVVIRFFIPATTANDLRLRRIFYPRFYPLHLFPYLNSWERASIFSFECSVLNNDTTGTIFITSLVWRSPWLGIEPGTSRTRSQHYTTRLSRKRLFYTDVLLL